MLALKPSHAWQHRESQIGSPWEAAWAFSGWEGGPKSGDWVKVLRWLRYGHAEEWWAMEVNAGPYGPVRTRRAVRTTTNLEKLIDKATCYLVSKLPHPDFERATESELRTSADLSEIVRPYELRMWVKQSYKQIKYVLGWSNYQVSGATCDLSPLGVTYCAFSLRW